MRNCASRPSSSSRRCCFVVIASWEGFALNLNKLFHLLSFNLPAWHAAKCVNKFRAVLFSPIYRDAHARESECILAAHNSSSPSNQTVALWKDGVFFVCRQEMHHWAKPHVQSPYQLCNVCGCGRRCESRVSLTFDLFREGCYDPFCNWRNSSSALN